MGKAALLLVAAVGLVTLYLSAGVYSTQSDTNTRSAEGQFEVLARNTVLAAEEMALQKLASSFQSFEQSGSHEGIPYELNVTTSGNTAVVEARATANTSGNDEVAYHLRAEYERVLSSVIPEEVPPFMRYVLVTEENLELSGTVGSDVYASGHEDNPLNADVHTNSGLYLNGVGSDRIRGHGTYVDVAQAGNPRHFERKFQPYFFYEESEGNPVYQVDPVEIPPMNMSYSAANQTVTINGDVTVPVEVLAPNAGSDTFYLSSSNFDPGSPTREYPRYYYVPANLSIAEDIEIPSYSVFLVDGAIDFGNRTVTAGPSEYDGGDESALAFYAAGEIRTTGNANVWAQIYSQSGATFGGGTPRIYGSVATRGSATFVGTVDLVYRQASPAMTVIWNGDAIMKLRRISYAEW